jgi:hypothetical protein
MSLRRPGPLALTVFQSGNSPALRLPKALGFAAGERLLASVEGDALVLRRADALGWPTGYFDSWEASSLEVPERGPRGARSARVERLFGKTARR